MSPSPSPESVPNKGCWYYRTVYECPVCGRGGEYRERKPPPKPENHNDTYHFEQHYDWCDAL